MVHPNSNPVSAGVLAAGLLAEACRSGCVDDLRLGTVRDLADDLGGRMAAVSAGATPDSLVEAAVACADLATLGSCNVSAIPDGGKPLAVAATHLAAGTTRALLALVEAGVGDPEDALAGNIMRDARSAGWKADLAVRQLG